MKNERQSSAEITIPEFADCLMIILSFCDLANIQKLIIEEVDEKDMVKLFINTYKIASSLTIDLDKEKLLKVLSNLLAISKLLNYSDERLYE